MKFKRIASLLLSSLSSLSVISKIYDEQGKISFFSALVVMSLVFDEFGRPFIIVKEQEKKKRLSGIEALKV